MFVLAHLSYCFYNIQTYRGIRQQRFNNFSLCALYIYSYSVPNSIFYNLIYSITQYNTV